jgi:hypothetical protein
MAIASENGEVPAVLGNAREDVPEVPPYSNADLIENGVACYKCEKHTAKSWSALMEHVRRQHGVSWSKLKGTHFHTMARKEVNEKDKKNYEAKKKNMAATATAEVPAAGGHLAGQKRTRDDDDDGVWKAMWVKVGSDGLPTWPLQVRDMIGANDVGKPSVASGSGNQQIANPLPTNATAKPASVLDAPPAVPAPAPANSAQPVVPGGDWASQLPKVNLKADYSTVTVPEPSASGARALWPVNLKGFQLDCPAFVSYLANDKNQGHSAQEDAGLEIHTVGPRRRQPL